MNAKLKVLIVHSFLKRGKEKKGKEKRGGRKKKRNYPGLSTVSGENMHAEDGDYQFEKPLNGT